MTDRTFQHLQLFCGLGGLSAGIGDAVHRRSPDALRRAGTLSSAFPDRARALAALDRLEATR